ncbi:MAG: hypothetical protein H7288_16240 [Kineosporiaceae bacterium]|nr:hypothetical protein [Aeromicrobium sp.]
MGLVAGTIIPAVQAYELRGGGIERPMVICAGMLLLLIGVIGVIASLRAVDLQVDGWLAVAVWLPSGLYLIPVALQNLLSHKLLLATALVVTTVPMVCASFIIARGRQLDHPELWRRLPAELNSTPEQSRTSPS